MDGAATGETARAVLSVLLGRGMGRGIVRMGIVRRRGPHERREQPGLARGRAGLERGAHVRRVLVGRRLARTATEAAGLDVAADEAAGAAAPPHDAKRRGHSIPW